LHKLVENHHRALNGHLAKLSRRRKYERRP
jgi:hypothetical protein